MRSHLGDYFLLQVQDEQGDLISVAGLRTRALTLKAQPLERLDFTVGGWRQLQQESGVHAMHILGHGLFAGRAADHLLRRLFLQGQHAKSRIILPDFGTFSGSFAIVELAYEGRQEDVISWRIALQSAGEIDFAVA